MRLTHLIPLTLLLTLTSPLMAQMTPAPLAPSLSPIPLAGEWRFAMDRSNTGLTEKWFSKDLSDRIKLPGILQSQNYGDEISLETPWTAALPRDMRWYNLPQYAPYTKPGNIKMPYLSQPPRHYLGLAWYQRDIDIPASWSDRRAHLTLERPRWETTAFIDDTKIGSNNSLCAPHEYELGLLTPGKHRLTILVNNLPTIVPGYRPDGHSVSDALGSSWNGIAGNIELTSTSPVWIDDAQVFPNVEKKSALIKVQIGNLTGKPGKGTLAVGSRNVPITWDANGGPAEFNLPLDASAQPWDEFHPDLHTINLQLMGDQAFDQRKLTFGLREIKTDKLQILLNGHEVNFRGTHSGGDFPLTGYPPTDVPSWKKIIQTCKDFGLNSLRFHSWCPPDAAFTAADELGFYIQPECGMWNAFSPNSPMVNMLELETTRIMKAYGNHPSFLLLSATNETSGSWQNVLPQWTERWYQKDPRRLFCTNTGRASATDTHAQYAIVPYRGNPGWFDRDYSNNMRTAQIPVITHEVGQYCAYPDFDIIQKFTGYLQPGNYEIFRDFAKNHGVLDRNKDFAWASGKFQLACYKQDIEATLRTPNISGYQLLDLHDYLGQGTALIGVLDTFWQPKSYVTAAEFHRFSGPTVPLARMRSSIYRTSDLFDIQVEIAHYGPTPLENAAPYWRIVDLAGKTAAQGALEKRSLPLGRTTLGRVSTDLSKLPAPNEYRLVVGIEGPDGKPAGENDWNFWLYPAQLDTTAPADLLITSNWPEAQARLATGGKVIFTPTPNMLDDTSPPLANVPVFWNRLMNPRLESMEGLWINTKHPAMAAFPTEAYCDWQWTDAIRTAGGGAGGGPRGAGAPAAVPAGAVAAGPGGGPARGTTGGPTARGPGIPGAGASPYIRAINIEKAPPELQPIVSAVDDYSRSYKLALIVECKVGPGSLLLCAPDIQNNLDNRTVARQLRRSLLDYTASDKFQPTITLTPAQVTALFPGPRGITAASQAAPPPEINETPTTTRPIR